MFFSKDKMVGLFNSTLSQMKSSDVGIAWVVNKKSLGIFNMDELVAQERIWVTCGKNLRCEDYNNRTYTHEGKVWYSLTLQEYDKNGNFIQTDDANPHDPFTLLVFGTAVNGYNYFFTNKDLRDAIAISVNDKNPIEYINYINNSGGFDSIASKFEELESKRPIKAVFGFMDCGISIKFKDKKELGKTLNRMRAKANNVPYQEAFERLFELCKIMKAGEVSVENDVHFATCVCVLFELGKLKQNEKNGISFTYATKEEKLCSLCVKPSKLRCQNCKVKYCSTDCQSCDWNTHKNICDHSKKPV